jgi:hypothetical protein
MITGGLQHLGQTHAGPGFAVSQRVARLRGIFEAQLKRIDAQFIGNIIQAALQQKSSLGRTRRSISRY